MNWTNPAVAQLFNTSNIGPSNSSGSGIMSLSPHHLRPGIIVAIVVPSIVGAFLLSVLLFWLVRRHRAQNTTIHSTPRTSHGSINQSPRRHEKTGPEVALEIATSATGTWPDRPELGPEMAAAELADNHLSRLSDSKSGPPSSG